MNFCGTGSCPTRQQPYRSAKRPRVDPAHVHLPPEIWEHIFRFIPGFQLLRMRLVCRYWNDVISGSPSLMDRFYFRLSGRGRLGSRMDRDYVPPGLCPMVTRLIVRRFQIDAVGTWFQDFAPKLTELQLIDCDLSVDVLFGMLRQTPNLKSLILFYLRFTGSGEPDFCMNKLKLLFVKNVGYNTDEGRHILDGFERMIPSLKSLVVGIDIESKKVEVLEWIRTMQASLQSLQLRVQPYIMEGLCQMQELRLTTVNLETLISSLPVDPDLWIRFCLTQPHVEFLTISLNDAATLLETGRLLPKLRQLSLNITGPLEVSFLEAMPRLEFLEICGVTYFGLIEISFFSPSCPNLEQILLRKVAMDDLFQFLQRCPKLTRMQLVNCDLNSIPEDTINFPNLLVLILFNIDCTNYLMTSLLNHCPNLEELHLFSLECLDDDTVREFCKKLKHLKKLSLNSLRGVTNKSARYVTRYCHQLKELSADFSDAELDRLEATRRNLRVVRHVDSDGEEDDDGDE